MNNTCKIHKPLQLIFCNNPKANTKILLGFCKHQEWAYNNAS